MSPFYSKEAGSWTRITEPKIIKDNNGQDLAKVSPASFDSLYVQILSRKGNASVLGSTDITDYSNRHVPNFYEGKDIELRIGKKIQEIIIYSQMPIS